VPKVQHAGEKTRVAPSFQPNKGYYVTEGGGGAEGGLEGLWAGRRFAKSRTEKAIAFNGYNCNFAGGRGDCTRGKKVKGGGEYVMPMGEL